MGVLLGEPFGRLRNHLVHGFDRRDQWEAPRTAGPRVRGANG